MHHAACNSGQQVHVELLLVPPRKVEMRVVLLPNCAWDCDSTYMCIYKYLHVCVYSCVCVRSLICYEFISRKQFLAVAKLERRLK